MNRINIICLGVKNMTESIHFYRDGLGFETNIKEDNPDVIFFNTNGTKFELYPLDLLAEDIDEENPPKIATGFAGITLAYNAKSQKEVDQVIEFARRAGGNVVKDPLKCFGVVIAVISLILMVIIGKSPTIQIGHLTKMIW